MTQSPSPDPRVLHGLAEIVGDYDVLLCDVWGVIHHGRQALPYALTALMEFRDQGGRVALITNAPVPSARVLATLDRVGAPRSIADVTVSSGDATQAALEDWGAVYGPAFHIGIAEDDPIYHGVVLEVIRDEARLGEAGFISCTGLPEGYVENGDPENSRPLLEKCLARELPMICANPDLVVRYGDRLVPCAGALAKLYADMGGTVRFCGKPHAPIYETAIERLEQHTGAPTIKERTLCVGDGLDTDVLGAEMQGYECLFILGGIHEIEHGAAEEALVAHKAQTLLQGRGRRAAYAMKELAWR